MNRLGQHRLELLNPLRWWASNPTLLLLLELILVVHILLILTILIVIVFNELIEVVFVRTVKFLEAKCSVNWLSQIVIIPDVCQKPFKEKEFLVCFVLFKRSNGDSVAQLDSEAVHGVVDQEHVFHIHVFENSQVFYINIVCGLNAAFSVKSVLEVNSFWVNIVEDNVCVPFVARCENRNFINFINRLE